MHGDSVSSTQTTSDISESGTYGSYEVSVTFDEDDYIDDPHDIFVSPNDYTSFPTLSSRKSTDQEVEPGSLSGRGQTMEAPREFRDLRTGTQVGSIMVGIGIGMMIGGGFTGPAAPIGILVGAAVGAIVGVALRHKSLDSVFQGKTKPEHRAALQALDRDPRLTDKHRDEWDKLSPAVRQNLLEVPNHITSPDDHRKLRQAVVLHALEHGPKAGIRLQQEIWELSKAMPKQERKARLDYVLDTIEGASLAKPESLRELSRSLFDTSQKMQVEHHDTVQNGNTSADLAPQRET
ncbi:MAG: hypothetical protein AAF637_03840 [Pseudomonadota bacterium]